MAEFDEYDAAAREKQRGWLKWLAIVVPLLIILVVGAIWLTNDDDDPFVDEAEGTLVEMPTESDVASDEEFVDEQESVADEELDEAGELVDVEEPDAVVVTDVGAEEEGGAEVSLPGDEGEVLVEEDLDDADISFPDEDEDKNEAVVTAEENASATVAADDEEDEELMTDGEEDEGAVVVVEEDEEPVVVAKEDEAAAVVTGEPLILEEVIVGADGLMEIPVVDVNGETATIVDALFDTEGKVAYIVADLDPADGTATLIPFDRLTLEDGMETAAELVMRFDGDLVQMTQANGLDLALLDQPGLLVTPADFGVANDWTVMLQVSDLGDLILADPRLVAEDDTGMGSVVDLLIEPDSGTVLFAVADLSPTLNAEEALIAIPLPRIMLDSTRSALIVNAEADTLAEAPLLDVAFLDTEAAILELDTSETETFWLRAPVVTGRG